jgi:hypothetical protein
LHDFIGGSCNHLAWSAKTRRRFNQAPAARLQHLDHRPGKIQRPPQATAAISSVWPA